MLSLEELDKSHLKIDFLFIDDNITAESSLLLDNFGKSNSTNDSAVTIYRDLKSMDEYICTEETHHWNESLVWKVANFKNIIIEQTLRKNYDYLLLIDSDIVIHPKTLLQLLKAQKDIISNIFWTKYDRNQQLELPQVWLRDFYDQVPRQRGEVLNNEEKVKRWRQFMQQLRQPGVYEVGGLGACTLISRRALEMGVNFKPITNLSFWGEDRHFCIRAVVLGLTLYVDTHYPAYHIYRESELLNLADYKSKNQELSNKVIQNVKRAIEMLGTYHDKQRSQEWQSLFTKKSKARLLPLLEKNDQKNLKQNITITITASDFLIEENHNFQKVRFTIIKKGTQDGKSFFEQLESFVIVLPDEKGDWLIDTLVVEDILE
ncbi:hypothetical protein SAMN02745123_02431 [Desulforamulus aeronauticus DSM 10349]|uniref:Glycosyl transferase family 2 n=1 Tax=Desulforamulus aeronauticus DSM 10349 TaxID=1121421 RepID=A0A1M6TQM6_9FIRM|nr:hypothetical protein SAMN02745123_02431 [Desulforamulus aeronauticus DSM 10349]